MESLRETLIVAWGCVQQLDLWLYSHSTARTQRDLSREHSRPGPELLNGPGTRAMLAPAYMSTLLAAYDISSRPVSMAENPLVLEDAPRHGR